MRTLIGILLISALVWTFRTVRAKPIIEEITRVAKRRSERNTVRESDAWMKNATRDTRPSRGPSIHDAPNYTTYTEETGRFRKSETGTFRKLS